MNHTLTALHGVQVGHATHPEMLTGCTVILFDRSLPVAYKSYGGVPGTFNTDNLRNGMSYAARDALFVAGGSANGLAAAATIAEAMVREKIGLQSRQTTIPSVSGATIWDLSVGEGQFDPDYGAEAFLIRSPRAVESGNVGAGTGASVGKFSYTDDGLMLNMKGGVGSARVDVGRGVFVCALSVVNAMGNIVLPNGSVLAGNRTVSSESRFQQFGEVLSPPAVSSSNTTITIVGTTADLESREHYERIAHYATQGQVRAIDPVNTSLDGDTVFVFSTKEICGFLNPLEERQNHQGWPNIGVDLIGNAAAQATRESIYDACRQAKTIEYGHAYKGIVPSCHDR